MAAEEPAAGKGSSEKKKVAGTWVAALGFRFASGVWVYREEDERRERHLKKNPISKKKVWRSAPFPP